MTCHILDQGARDAWAKGYRRSVIADGGPYTLELLVKPDVDLDGSFKAYDLDEGQWLTVHGYNFTFEEA